MNNMPEKAIYTTPKFQYLERIHRFQITSCVSLVDFKTVSLSRGSAMVPVVYQSVFDRSHGFLNLDMLPSMKQYKALETFGKGKPGKSSVYNIFRGLTTHQKKGVIIH